MRVAILGSFPLDANKIPGGVEAVIRNLALSMAKFDGMDIHILTCVGGLGNDVDKDIDGVTIHYLPGQQRLGNVSKGCIDRKRLLAKLRRIEPSIVHAHGSGHYAMAALDTSHPAIITVHGILWRESQLYVGLKGWVRRRAITRMERTVLRRAKHIFVIADYVRDAIAPYTSARLYPIQNPVDNRFFDQQTSDSGSTILSVAAIQLRKGLLHLIEALVQIRPELPDAKIHFVGKVIDANYDQRLHQAVAQRGLQEAVHFLGYVSEEELMREFSSCSVFALCSVEESSPVSIAEAMTLSKPVVATRAGGVPDLVEDGVTGYLVDHGDVGAIATALRNLLRDRDLCSGMGKAGRERADSCFRTKVAARRTIDVYHEVITEERSSR